MDHSMMRFLAFLVRLLAILLAIFAIGYILPSVIGDGNTAVKTEDLLSIKYWLRVGVVVGYLVSFFREYRGALIAVLCWGLFVGLNRLDEVPMIPATAINHTKWLLLPVPFLILSGFLRGYLRRSATPGNDRVLGRGV